jgi:DNA replication ATP-dependent helicase Dna2
MPSADSLKRTMSSARIVGVTALSIPRSPLLIGEHFDVVIVDEAGQISQPAIIGALISADSFVLVGDHMQLPPLVSSELAEKGGK